MRINRFLASAGVGSRRACEALVLAGRVTLNGQPCTSLATRVEPSDTVRLDGRALYSESPLYLALNKPRGYLCTAKDPGDRRIIFELVPAGMPRLFYVGRLDKDSEGLILLTNDGDLALHMTHPRHKVEKEYEVTLDRPFDPVAKEKLLRGFPIEGGRGKMESIQVLTPTKLRIVLRQGIKRQIRLMLYRVGYEVKRLIRTRIGFITLHRLAPGQTRQLTAKEVKILIRDSQK